MDIFSNHLFGWLLVITSILGALYAMRVIRQEKSSFKDESYVVQFSNLSLMIPRWWTIVEQSEFKIRFERTDSRYYWYSVFAYYPDHQGKSLPDLLSAKLDLEKIEFDTDVVFETDSRVLFRDSKIQEHFQEVIRVEGKGSQDVIERLYYDIYIMRAQDDAGYFMFESWSSVLHGMLEGPYFEESLSELSFIHEA